MSTEAPHTLDVTITEDDARTILRGAGWCQRHGLWISPQDVACEYAFSALAIALHDHAETLRKDANHADPPSR